jgi:hypothetical protein
MKPLPPFPGSIPFTPGTASSFTSVVDDILPVLEALPIIDKSLAVYKEWAASGKR